MDVHLDVNKVLEAFRAKLHEVSDENIMLRCLVDHQQAELQELRGSVDELSREVTDGSKGEEHEDLSQTR